MLIPSFQKTKFIELLEEESIQMILKGLENNTIRISNQVIDEVFCTIAKFPHYSNRLAWDKIPHIAIHPPSQQRSSAQQREIAYGKQLKEFIYTLGGYFEIMNQYGILFEDHFSDCMLEISFSNFCRLDTEFFYTPGHKYLLGINNHWLLNVTMEGDVYFSQRISY